MYPVMLMYDFGLWKFSYYFIMKSLINVLNILNIYITYNIEKIYAKKKLITRTFMKKILVLLRKISYIMGVVWIYFKKNIIKLFNK